MDSVTRWKFFWWSNHLNQYCTFCVCADGFQVFQKLFTTLYNYINFEILLILKMHASHVSTRVKIAALGSLKKVTERSFEISK
jgi:hypothetical protein